MSGLRQARRRRPSADRSALRSRRNVRWRRAYGGLKVDQARRLKALEKEKLRLRKAVSDLTLEAMILIVGGAAGGSRESDLRPSRRRLAVDHVREVLGVSERRVCRVLGQNRSTQRKPKVVVIDEAKLTADIIRLARQYGRYGYRRITALLRREGWTGQCQTGGTVAGRLAS